MSLAAIERRSPPSLGARDTALECPNFKFYPFLCLLLSPTFFLI
nr:hypothetical protein AOSUZXEW_AOSUZXEW_CDS_0009 [Microvirus sp.]